MFWELADMRFPSPQAPDWRGLRPIGVGKAIFDNPAEVANVDSERDWADTA